MSSIANLKHAMGWQHPTLRDRCANCNHVENGPPEVGYKPVGSAAKPSKVCGKGSFFTHPNAVCKDHVRVGS